MDFKDNLPSLISNAQLDQLALNFVTARGAQECLRAFPGQLPRALAAAYRCQDHAIRIRGGELGGWKVGFIAPSARDESQDERVLGPIFADLIQQFEQGRSAFGTWSPIVGGFAAVEAEFVIRLKSDLPIGYQQQSDFESQILNAIADIHVGVEFAGSPFAHINRVGPIAVASDFGNNAGLWLGPAIEQWQAVDFRALRSETIINGELVGSGSAASVPGGPLAAFAFAVKRLWQRGYDLPAGCLIATGASTGIHDVRAGDNAQLRFSIGDRELFCFNCRVDARADGVSL